MYINQLLHILGCFLKVLGNHPSSLCPVDSTTPARPTTEPPGSGSDTFLKHEGRAVVVNEDKGHRCTEEISMKLMRLNEFLLASNTDNINLFKVCGHGPLSH